MPFHYRDNKTLQSLAPIAYVLRNIKLLPWPRIASILNFNHYFPSEPVVSLIRATKDYALYHNIEPPVSHHQRPNMIITYNLFLLGMPASDIHRFQKNQIKCIENVYHRINSLSKSLNIPNPLKQDKSSIPLNPLPKPMLKKTKAPIDLAGKSPHSFINLIPSVDKAILAIELIFVDKQHPQLVADTLHFKSVKSLLSSINFHLKKDKKLPFSYKELFSYHPKPSPKPSNKS